ncbi:MAG: YdcF family protein [Polyangiales bacterium]
MAETTTTDDPTLVQDVTSVREAKQRTAPSIVPYVDRWLLRAEGHRASVGTQLARWCIAAQGRADTERRQESRGCLQVVADTYGVSLDAWLDNLGALREFKKIVPGNTPRKSSPNANHWGLHKYRALLAASEPDAERLARYADGTEDSFHTAGGWITYFYAPFRAAFLRAILASWFAGNDALARIADTAQSVTSRFLRNTTPSGRTMLGFLLCEAVDDELFLAHVVDERRVASDGREETFALKSPGGARYVEFLQRWVVPVSPDPAHEEAAAAELRAYAQALAQVEYRATRSADGVVIHVVRKASVSDAERGQVSTFRLHPFDAIIVCGFTPLDSKEPTTKLPEQAQHRVDQAARDFHHGLAPFIIVSGGAVYPMGTPTSEAILMRDALVEHEDAALRVPASRVVLDYQARHTPTNVRNPGRILRRHGLGGDVIVVAGDDTDITCNPFEQDEYMAGETPFVSYEGRCVDELGFVPYHFMLRPSEYGGRIAEWRQKAEDEGRPPSQRVARYLYHRDLIAAHLPDEMHLVTAITPEVSRRFNVRDALDP